MRDLLGTGPQPSVVLFLLRGVSLISHFLPTFENCTLVAHVRAEKNENIGFNALTEEYEDLVAAGVVDPTKVTRTALQNAASIAGLLLTTEVMIADFPEPFQAQAMPGGEGAY